MVINNKSLYGLESAMRIWAQSYGEAARARFSKIEYIRLAIREI